MTSRKPPTPAATMARIRELAAMPDGWLDGEGLALPREGVAWFRGLVVSLLARGLPRFWLYPRLDTAHAVQLEWVFCQCTWACELIVHLDSRMALFSATHLHGDHEAEVDGHAFDLRSGAHCRHLVHTVRAYSCA